MNSYPCRKCPLKNTCSHSSYWRPECYEMDDINDD